IQIDIQLIPLQPNSSILLNRTVVVIDVLRSTSVMTHALTQGALEIIPMATVEAAFQRAKVFPQGSVILGGEMRNKRISGFDLGTSPREGGEFFGGGHNLWRNVDRLDRKRREAIHFFDRCLLLCSDPLSKIRK